MAEYLHFSRDSRLYMEKDGYLWSIPVLDGFSFSQATNSSEITLNEMEDSTGRSRRGRKMFTDSLSAAEWSFSSYIRPFKSAGSKSATNGLADTSAHNHAVEEALWVAMAGKNVYVPGSGKFNHGATGGAISSFTTTAQGTDNGSGHRAQGVYNIAIPTTTATSPTAHNQALVSTGGVTNGANAVVQVTVSAAGVATSKFTERGSQFINGNKITIGSQLLGGSAAGGNLELTVKSESFESDATDLDINFFDSSRAALGTFNLYYVFSDRTEGRLIYKLSNAVVNEAAIDFDIDGIATINWSGMAGQITEVQNDKTGTVDAGKYRAAVSEPSAAAAGAIWIDTNDSDKFYISTGSGTNFYTAITEGTTSTGNFIRNRLTQLTLVPETAFQAATTFNGPAGAGDTYNITGYQVAITGGSVTISNNISYLTPEELGKVNQPIEHITGTRTVTGSATCYLASSDAATNKSRDLFADLVSDTNTVINKFAINLKVGGTDATKPRFEINLPLAHLEIPSHSIEDVISLETNFHGLGTGVGEGDEVSLKYIGV